MVYVRCMIHDTVQLGHALAKWALDTTLARADAPSQGRVLASAGTQTYARNHWDVPCTIGQEPLGCAMYNRPITP